MSGFRSMFSKSVCPGFDQIDLQSLENSEWLTITMRVGGDVERVTITIRSDEAVRDLHYALGRYLAHIEAAE